MFKKFIDGLAFGAGFSIAFVILWTVVSLFVFPAYFESQFADLEDAEITFSDQGSSSSDFDFLTGGGEAFYTLSIEDKIDRASAIALAEYQLAEDGRMRAIITEYLKLDEGTELRYEVGDEYPSSSYYPTEDKSRGDGVVIFFTGSPATMQMSSTYSGERITGLGDIPLALFRNKCEDDGA